MHWAAHGHTAAELIHQSADSGKSHMGLSNFAGKEPRKSEVAIAKNYLREDELKLLNRIVTAYLEFAELQAELEYDRYRKVIDMQTTQVDKDLEAAIRKLPRKEEGA